MKPDENPASDLPRVEVVYRDHASFDDESLENLDRLTPWTCRAVGYLQEENETFLRILSIVEEDPREPGVGTCAGVVILRCAVLQVHRMGREGEDA